MLHNQLPKITMANITKVYFAEKCDAFTTFLDATNRDQKCMRCLNPRDGIVGGTEGPLGLKACEKANASDREVIQDIMGMLLRSAVVQCIVTFEAYVHELFGEAFDEVCTSESTFKICQGIVTGSQKRDGAAQQYQSLSAFREAMLEKITQPKFRDIKRTIADMFFVTQNKMTGLVSMLTRKEQFLVELQIPDENPLDINPRGSFTKATYVITDIDTISQLLNLFYGVRCVCAHGNAKATFKGKGCLTNFDASKLKITFKHFDPQCLRNETEIPESFVRQYFQEVYDQMKKSVDEGYPMPINYHLYLNASNFIRRFATNFLYVVGCLTYHLQDKAGKRGDKFWGTKIAEWETYAGHVFPDESLDSLGKNETDPQSSRKLKTLLELP